MGRSTIDQKGVPGLAGFPEPDADACEHSRRLCEYIHDEIADQGGSISFARYMELALYAPGLGYYSAGARKFGAAGDFITAPGISPLFSQCLARQCQQILNALDGGIILELGAGTGIMACDVMLELERQHCLPAQYLILEVSADLRQRQQATILQYIPHLSSYMDWLDVLPDDGIAGIILANEVLDAMPVHRFVLHDAEIKDLRVVSEGGRFHWKDMPSDPLLAAGVREILGSSIFIRPEAYTSEINLGLSPWLLSLADVLTKGAMLFIDYGYPAREYYHPQRSDGTLLCHYRHRVHDDPFLYPGLQDITASVNFTQLAEAAVSAGLAVSGYTTQAYFLFACGLENLMGNYEIMEIKMRLELSRQVQMLTLPGEMGERFKVMGLTRGLEFPLLGFSLVDQRVHL
ncbi:MAG: hypothetical protein A2W28_11385 [Gammaproteobacteria bacterium RBG_16_51_14]|nr:MAG: hypothetical protein A2W28_11385 [Gammaproteobacteria bacterium RBG_16_51_14]